MRYLNFVLLLPFLAAAAPSQHLSLVREGRTRRGQQYRHAVVAVLALRANDPPPYPPPVPPPPSPTGGPVLGEPETGGMIPNPTTPSPPTPVPPAEGGPIVPAPPVEGGPIVPAPPVEGGPVVPNPPAEGGPIVPEQPKEGGPIVPDPPKEGGPLVPEKPKEGGPIVPDLPNEGGPIEPDPPKEGGPIVPDPPNEGGPIVPDPPKEDGPIVPDPTTPSDPVHDVPGAPEPAPQPEPANPDAPPSYPPLPTISSSGPGCPASGNSSVVMSGNWTELSFVLSKFAVESGKAPMQNCALRLQITGAAPGWQLGIQNIIIGAWAVLEPGMGIEYFLQSFWSADAANTKTIHGQFTNTQQSILSSAVTIDTTIADDDEILWSPCVGADGYAGMLNVNLRFILRNSAGADATVQSPYGYFGGHSDEKAGINISTTEDWIYAWRKCQVEQ